MTRNHEAQCAVCGSFLPLLREGEKSIKCPKCGTVWESDEQATDKE